LGNTQKDFIGKLQENSDTKYTLFDLKAKVTKIQHQLTKAEFDLVITKETEERIARESKDTKLQTEVVNQQLKENQDELTKTKHELSDLQEDYKNFLYDNMKP